ncbi:polysaccharide biosynthesis/export family protein [Anaerohalosphaera lusitana]|nr:SLBB domain-containing protein [Anaerohalosphaera lusitana]
MLSTPEQLEMFHAAGPIKTEIDVEQLMQAKVSLDEYRLVQGDMLEFQMPAVLAKTDVQIESEQFFIHRTRVASDGTIQIPVIGQVHAAGKTLVELEKTVTDAFYPRYARNKPAIVANISQYQKAKVSITGAVENPGVYSLRSDQMSLVSLIMEAGGVVEDGAAVIKIFNPGARTAKVGGPEGIVITAAQMPDSKQVQFSFVSQAGGSKGVLKLKRGGELIFSDLLDVAKAEDREGFIGEVTSQFNDIPKSFVSKRLNALAQAVAPDSVDTEEANPKHAAVKEDTLPTAAKPIEEEPEKTKKDHNTKTQDTAGKVRKLTLPVKGLNVPFSDVALQDGASVEVEALNPETFTVIGLVKKAGAFPYPANVNYNLLQALAFAGGVDPVTDPRYVRVYRQDNDGQVVDATFKLNDTLPASGASVSIKPGDVVSVEHTPRTRRNMLMAEILGVRLGVGATYNMIDGKDLRNY